MFPTVRVSGAVLAHEIATGKYKMEGRRSLGIAQFGVMMRRIVHFAACPLYFAGRVILDRRERTGAENINPKVQILRSHRFCRSG